MPTSITFHKLKPELYGSILAQALQIMEEAGELAEKIGLLTGDTGKRKQVPENIVELVIEEALDVAQSACGVIFATVDKYGIDFEQLYDRFYQKLRERGYIP